MTRAEQYRKYVLREHIRLVHILHNPAAEGGAERHQARVEQARDQVNYCIRQFNRYSKKEILKEI